MHSKLILLGALPIALGQTAFKPAPGNFPAKGDDVNAGGIFSIPLSELPKYAGAGGTGPEGPTTAGAVTTGSGPYPAKMLTDSSLPNHTIFAPINKPNNVSMPFIAWGNGACQTN